MNNKVNEKGRPSKYDEKTVTVGMRVPISKVDDFKEKAENILITYQSGYATKSESMCTCKLLGKSPTGKEIWQRCSKHKNIK